MTVLRRTLCLVLLAASMVVGAGARAEDDIPPGTRVDVALVLAVDVSASISKERFLLQRDGLAAAFRSEAVIRAVTSGANKKIAVTLVQWSGPTNQDQTIGWHLVIDAGSAESLARKLDGMQRAFVDFTSISTMLDYSAWLLHSASFAAARQVIDVSGDGQNNSGRPLDEARAAALQQGITINGLAILATEKDLDVYYRDNLIGGPGAFMIVAREFEDFADAMRNKLEREIAGLDGPGAIYAAAGAAVRPADQIP